MILMAGPFEIYGVNISSIEFKDMCLPVVFLSEPDQTECR
jgi:hypothetical protein